MNHAYTGLQNAHVLVPDRVYHMYREVWSAGKSGHRERLVTRELVTFGIKILRLK